MILKGATAWHWHHAIMLCIGCSNVRPFSSSIFDIHEVQVYRPFFSWYRFSRSRPDEDRVAPGRWTIFHVMSCTEMNITFPRILSHRLQKNQKISSTSYRMINKNSKSLLLEGNNWWFFLFSSCQRSCRIFAKIKIRCERKTTGSRRVGKISKENNERISTVPRSKGISSPWRKGALGSLCLREQGGVRALPFSASLRLEKSQEGRRQGRRQGVVAISRAAKRVYLIEKFLSTPPSLPADNPFPLPPSILLPPPFLHTSACLLSSSSSRVLRFFFLLPYNIPFLFLPSVRTTFPRLSFTPFRLDLPFFLLPPCRSSSFVFDVRTGDVLLFSFSFSFFFSPF